MEATKLTAIDPTMVTRCDNAVSLAEFQSAPDFCISAEELVANAGSVNYAMFCGEHPVRAILNNL